MENLIEGIQKQCNRCRTLVGHYDDIGAVGIFGKTMIQAAIKEGESAIASGDVVRMLTAYKSLEGCK